MNCWCAIVVITSKLDDKHKTEDKYNEETVENIQKLGKTLNSKI